MKTIVEDGDISFTDTDFLSTRCLWCVTFLGTARHICYFRIEDEVLMSVYSHYLAVDFCHRKR